MTDTQEDTPDLIELTASIVSAFVGRNHVTPEDLPKLIEQTHEAFTGIAARADTESTAPSAPAISVKKSVTPDLIVCLECGEKFKTIKRHLSSQHGLDPSEYRQKWRLPADYPITAPNYTAKRAELAKKFGLGGAVGKYPQARRDRRRSGKAS